MKTRKNNIGIKYNILAGLISTILFFLIFESMSHTVAAPAKNAIQAKRLDTIELPFSIIHAGGFIKGISYTNSFQAFENSLSSGFNFIEVDLIWTSDRQLVLLHDWEETVTRLFHVEPKIYSLEDFNSFTMIEGLKQFNLEDLTFWLVKHPDAFIITDIKWDNVYALAYIAQHYPDIKNQVIPQIYYFEEYDKVRSLGYKNIIFTLVKSDWSDGKTPAKSLYSDEEILRFVKKYPVLAMAISKERAITGLFQKLNSIGVFVYVYVVNQIEEMRELINKGVNGFYTDVPEKR